MQVRASGRLFLTRHERALLREASAPQEQMQVEASQQETAATRVDALPKRGRGRPRKVLTETKPVVPGKCGVARLSLLFNRCWTQQHCPRRQPFPPMVFMLPALVSINPT